MIIDPGATNRSLYVYFVDDDGGTAPGEPTTGKLFSDIETGGSASYMRQGAARVDFELFTLASASAAHTDGGFILVDDTNMPGLYRVDVPDAAFASGVDFVVIQLVMASANNSIMRPLLVDLSFHQAGDSFARLGAPAGASIAADLVTADAAIDVAVADLANGTDGLGALKTLIDTVNTDLSNGTDGLGALKTLIDALNDAPAVTAAAIVNEWETQSQADPTGFHVNVKEVNGTAQTAGDIAALVVTADAAIDVAVADLANGTDGLSALKTLIDALNDLSAAQVNTEVVDVIYTDAISEIAQGVPSATPNLADAVMLMYMALRDKLVVQTSGTDALEIYNDAGTKIAKKLITDDGSDYTEAKMTSGA